MIYKPESAAGRKKWAELLRRCASWHWLTSAMVHCKGSKGLWVGEWAWSSLASAGSLSPSFGCNSFRSLFPPKVKEIPFKKSKIRKRRKEGERGVVSSLEDLNWFDFRNLENLIFFFWLIFLVWRQRYLGKPSCYYRVSGDSGGIRAAGSIAGREEGPLWLL